MFLVDDGIVDGGSEPHVGDVKEHFGGSRRLPCPGRPPMPPGCGAMQDVHMGPECRVL